MSDPQRRRWSTLPVAAEARGCAHIAVCSVCCRAAQHVRRWNRSAASKRRYELSVTAHAILSAMATHDAKSGSLASDQGETTPGLSGARSVLSGRKSLTDPLVLGAAERKPSFAVRRAPPFQLWVGPNFRDMRRPDATRKRNAGRRISGSAATSAGRTVHIRIYILGAKRGLPGARYRWIGKVCLRMLSSRSHQVPPRRNSSSRRAPFPA